MSQIIKQAVQSLVDSMSSEVESLSVLLFSTPLIIDPAQSDLIDLKFGSGAWSRILSSILKGPASRNSLSGDVKVIADILQESIGRIVSELESLSHDTKDLMKEMNIVQSSVTDTKIIELVEAVVTNTNVQPSIFQIPGEIGDIFKAKFAEDVQTYLAPTFLIETIKVSLYNFAFEINQLKSRIVELGISSLIGNTSNLSNLATARRPELTAIVKEKVKSTEAEVEVLVMSIFDLTIQLDQARGDGSLHGESDGHDRVLEKILAFNQLSGIVSSGAVDKSSLTSIGNILNGKLLERPDPLDFSEVTNLFKLTVRDEQTPSVYSELLNLHQG